VILISFLVTITKNVFVNKALWKRSDIDIPLLFLVIIALYSSCKSQMAPPQIAFFDLFLLLKGFMVFYIFYNLDYNLEDLSKMMKIFFWLALTILLLGIADLIAPHSFRMLLHGRQFVEYRFGVPSAQSIFIHPGQFGWFMAFCAASAGILFCNE